MATLVKEVVGIEEEAESIIAQARADAKQLEKAYEEEIKAYRNRMSDEIKEKIDAFHKTIEEANTIALHEEELRLKESLEAIDNISQDALERQVNAIISRVLNL